MISEPPKCLPGPRELDLERVMSEQIGTSAITSAEALVRRVEDLLLDTDEMLRDAERRKDPHWWRYADHRDDLVDVLLAVVSKFGGAST